MSLNTDWSGVFAVDPGGTTGVAWGVFPESGSVRTRIRRGKRKGETEIVPGGEGGIPNVWSPEMDAALQVVQLWIQFARKCCEHKVMPRLVIEDFVLRPGRKGTTDRIGLSPVRVTAMIEVATWVMLEQASLSMMSAAGPVEGEFRGEEWLWAPVLQMPAHAKSFATDARLKNWGVWVKGKPHARDAWRHVALRLAKGVWPDE